MPVYRNDRTGEEIAGPERAQLAKEFAELGGDSWLWFHLAKAVANKPTKATSDMLEFVADSFVYAVGMGLKRPMIRTYFAGRRFKLYLSRNRTLCMKSGAVDEHGSPMGDEEYVGCFHGGRLLPARERPVHGEERMFLDMLEHDAPGFLAICSRDMNRCCYCNLPLEDPRSKAVGYGATCAAHWGLPWGGGASGENVPSFAKEWKKAGDTRSVRSMCRAIRADPYDPALWDVFGDALEDAGFSKRPTCPSGLVLLPR